MATDDCTPSPIQLPLPLDETTTFLSSKGKVGVISVCDADLLDHKWSALNPTAHIFYAFRMSMKDRYSTSLLMHRVIMERVLNRKLKPGEEVDHIDGNGMNNARSNLRVVTSSQNKMNTRLRSNNTSGYKGVTWHKASNAWRAQIRVNGKYIRLGLFKDAEDASDAYKKAALKHFGEYARFK